MTPTRSPSDERKYKRRGLGVMKKAFKIHDEIEGIKAAVLFLDGSNLWIYESEAGFTSTLDTVVNVSLHQAFVV
jgi:hypothetical protein